MASSNKEHPASALLSRAHSPDTASTILRERIKQRPLLLRPSSPDPDTNARTARRLARQKTALETRRHAKSGRKSKKPRPLSAKQKRALCLYEIPKEQRRYELYLGLHELWCGYMREILGFSAPSSMDGKGQGQKGQVRNRVISPAVAGPVLAGADYHGAKIEVVRCRCVSRVGIKGIVVKDLKFVFEIITMGNEIKTVPKEGTVFRFEVPLQSAGGGGGQEDDDGVAETKPDGKPFAKPIVFEIQGSQFEHRAPDRATRKFKMHIDPEL